MPLTHADGAAEKAVRLDVRDRIAALLQGLPLYFGTPGAAESRIELARACKLVVKHREAIHQIVLPSPVIVAVLDGTKTVHLGGRAEPFTRGDFLILPHSLKTDMVNEPCPERAIFRTAVVEILPRTLRSFQKLYPEIVRKSLESDVSRDGGAADPSRFRLTVGETLGESLVHTMKGLIRGESSGPIAEHRLYELILALVEAGKGGYLFTLTGEDVLADATRLIALDPSQRWGAEELAARLGLSVSTLSRRLRNKGCSLRALLDDARMGQALRLLQDGAGSIAEVARACGYESHSRFSARFRERYSVSPSELRRQAP
jgi:AraC-like DNA-binding protein